MKTVGISRTTTTIALFLSLISSYGIPLSTLHAAVAAPIDEHATSATSSQKGRTIAPPSDLVGRPWSWTTISSINYQNTTTGQLASPSGMSAKFTFTKDGRYTKFFYIQQRTYGLITQATTTESGTATFNDNGTVILRSTKGHYLGNTGSRKIDRDMTAAERKPTTWFWEWRTGNNQRNLYLGPSPSSLSHFQRDK